MIANRVFSIQVKLFAIFREKSRKSEINLVLPMPSTVHDLREILAKVAPELFIDKIPFLISVNHQIAHENMPIAKNDEVALLPPVSGGT